MRNIGVIVALLVPFILVSCDGNMQKTPTNDTSAVQSEPAPVVTEIKEVQKDSPYLAYNANALVANEPNILQFHADWCPSCNTLQKSLSETGIPDGINIFKVDYDTETELKKKYGVTMQHTSVLVDENGNMIKKWSGSFTIDDILAELN